MQPAVDSSGEVRGVICTRVGGRVRQTAERGYELLPHPPYLLDPAPCDFCFPIAERTLAWFPIFNDVVASVGDLLQGQESQDELFYKTGIQKLQGQWKKCIEVREDYVEK